MPSSKKTSLFADLKAVFFIGFGLLIVGLFGFMDRHPDSGSVVIAGSILMGAAVIGNSISPTPIDSDDDGAE